MVRVEEVHEGPERRCAHCNDPGSSKLCALCRDVSYCSKGCQQAHWKAHKKACSRAFAPAAKGPPQVRNPCARCGQEGVRHNGSAWFCSLDCSTSDVNDITAKIKKLSDASAAGAFSADKDLMDKIKKLTGPDSQCSAATGEAKRLQDFITSSVSAASTKPGSDPAAGLMQAKKQNDRLQDFITSSVSAASPKPGSDAAAGLIKGQNDRFQEQKDRLQDMIRKAEREPCLPAAADPSTAEVHEKLRAQQAARRKEERAQAERKRFTEWVSWAQAEIQRKKLEEEAEEEADAEAGA